MPPLLQPSSLFSQISATMAYGNEDSYIGIDYGAHSIYITASFGETGEECCSQMMNIRNSFQSDIRILYGYDVRLKNSSAVGVYRNEVCACDKSMIYVLVVPQCNVLVQRQPHQLHSLCSELPRSASVPTSTGLRLRHAPEDHRGSQREDSV